MKSKIALIIIVAVAVLFFVFRNYMGKEPWTDKQLMEPAELARIINNPTEPSPFIYSIGFEADIQGSLAMGPARDDANLKHFKAELSLLPKDAEIVVYCGCCPFEHCPNIRPAFKLLNDMGFTNAKLLNLPHNLKTDWIDKGFPVNK